MNDLEDVNVKHSRSPKYSSFHNLRVLVVSKCAELKYLFTLDVAKVLSNLEHLEVSDCPIIKELISTEGRGEETITFPKLKILYLSRLPELLSLCQNVNIIVLSQLVELTIEDIPNVTSIYSKNKLATSCLLREEVLIPTLKKLHIENMDGLKEIWPCDFDTSDQEVKLREIEVVDCYKLVNLFPCNPMPFLQHLEELQLLMCGSIEMLFNIDLDCEIVVGSSRLRSIQVTNSGKLREVWRIKGGENNSRLRICGFQDVESIKIYGCSRFRNLYAPTTTNFDFGALIDLNIYSYETYEGLVESSQGQEINVAFPSCLIHSFHNLRKLKLEGYDTVEVIFEIESAPRSQDNQQRILPYLEELHMARMERMSHVWKCNWNDFLILHNQLSESPFHNLTTIFMFRCHSIKYLFSPLMARLLSNLKEIELKYCYGIEEVVSHRDDEDEDQATFTSTSTHAITTLFPHLASLTLKDLKNIKCIGGAKGGNNEISVGCPTTTTSFLDQHKVSQEDDVSWTLCQYPRKIEISNCQLLSSVIPCYATGHMQKLQVLKIDNCHGMKEVFETQRINNRVIMQKLTNVKKLKIYRCELLEHIFTLSTLESLIQLEKLSISKCKMMKVIVKEQEDGEQTTTSSKAVVFPRLKCIELRDLPELVGFFLGTNEFLWTSLDDLTIFDCPQMKVFTAGGSTAPQLEYVQTRLGKHSPGSWFESHVSVTTTTTWQNQHQESTSSSCPVATVEGINNWAFLNLIELHVESYKFAKKHIVPSNELLHLQNLEKIHVYRCNMVEKVFEALEGTNSRTGSDESSPTTIVVKLPNLIEVALEDLDDLRYIWKSNRWTLFVFPKLTKVTINGCQKLQHGFTSSMVGSLNQLQELSISWCNQMEEVIVNDDNAVVEVEEEEYEEKMTETMMLPRLKSLKLYGIPCLKGFFLGNEDFSFPLLDTLTINFCQEITTFTKGNSSAPELKEIETGFGWFHVNQDINSFIDMKHEEFKRDGDRERDRF